MADINIRIVGQAGRLTLTRPEALNALTHEMCHAIMATLDDWAENDQVRLVVIDAEGDKAFCAGGDLHELYETGRAENYVYGRQFWTDEYRLNARIAEYPKPFVALMQGYTLGGGVGLSCHGSQRIVCETSQISMPECGIGLVPDVGGSLLLARAPGRLGEFLGTTATRMGPDDAIYAGFADTFIPQVAWPDLISELEQSGSTKVIEQMAAPPPEGTLSARQSEIDAVFGGADLRAILNAMDYAPSAFNADTRARMARNSPLAMACTIEMIHRLRGGRTTIRDALELEYRFTYRAMEQGDFLEGVRAAVIDKDRAPAWQHTLEAPPMPAVTQMLMPLGRDKLRFETQEETT
ncbi:MAG: enoyl-CoA hydratase/isomerase family protein [Pseudomonadota bacterium]